MSIARLAAVIALPILLAACGEPVPQTKADYVGEWRGPKMRLSISADGNVGYERQRESGRTSINAPIQAFEGDDFIVGVGWMRTRFVVSKPPHREGAVWKMTVDGVELTRGAIEADRWARMDRQIQIAQG